MKLTLLVLTALQLGFVPAVSAAAASRPNIIYILTDDLGIGDLGCYGQKTLSTPHIDRLAAEGMKFQRHYSGSTVCAPSRCVLMTGLHTGHCRVRGNDDWLIPDSDVTVPSHLKRAGYATACFGKYGLGKPLPADDPQRKGFEEFFGYVDTSHAHNFYPTYLLHNGQRVPLPNLTVPGSNNGKAHEDVGYATLEGRKVWAPGLIADKLQDFLRAPARKQQPFFIYYALNLPHANNEAGRKDSPLGHGLESPSYGEFASKDWPPVEKGFAQFIRFIDDEVGRILATLKAQGLDDKTLVLFSSDNGAHAEGGHDSDFFDSNSHFTGIKRSLTDGGIHVPLIARWPGQTPAGSLSQHVSGFQDLLPTVAELSGQPLTCETDGLSFAAEITGQADRQAKHQALFWDFNEQGGKRALLQWPWKLIHLNTNPNKPNARGKEVKPNAKLQVHLYNLEADPSEQTNLADSEPERVAKMQALMQAAYRAP